MNILKDMELFVRIVHCDGLAAAGRELGMTPSSVTMRIKKLEMHYQVKLLARTTRSINLTDSGREFYLDSLKMLEHLGQVESKLTSSNATISGPLRITAPSDLGRQHIAPLINQFKEDHPDVTPFLNLSDSVTDLTESNIDLAIRYGIDPNSQLIAHKVAESRRVLCASQSYLDQYGVPEAPQDLANHLCLTMVQIRTPLSKWFFSLPDGEISITINPSRSCDDGAQIRNWAVEGAGIALKSYWDVAMDLQTGRLVTLLDDFHPDYQSKKLSIGADLYVAYQDRKYLPKRIREFNSTLKTYFQNVLG
ncbi:MAG: LysR family transcriptional regulator [Granulosicoccus sp.]